MGILPMFDVPVDVDLYSDRLSKSAAFFGIKEEMQPGAAEIAETQAGMTKGIALSLKLLPAP